MAFNAFSYVGFGDHCVAYGIIVEFIKRYGKVHYYTDEASDEQYNTYKRLYSNVKDVEIIREPFQNQVKLNHSIANTPYWYAIVGPWTKTHTEKDIPRWFSDWWVFDRQWYMNASVPFYLKWDNFNFQRDLKREKEVYYDVLGLKDNEQYLFMQEDIVRNRLINRKYINKDIKTIEFDKLPYVNVLDIMYTVEKAKEVHLYNTGLLSFLDLMHIKHDNLNYHKYVRPAVLDQPALRSNWKILE